ncbi:30S ribosomal protein S7 [Candidatus Jorgensenbacteria bacterium GWA1_49_17]|uniref:Small ribosomal subunit protein uS7 n=2 Tax=Candidatus Joergenseniibacteriota TaxID=1752739 RepID=A0A1F6BQF1_9BACT|nr:MAG: 30S ribosomal protein S7 [Candidatus Jorgensenbacteria bacterium GWC1_48_12]OGG40483.1 MAG: 30S ribosomal protein S7 [Candidatus Jorgensenbacteria bacterium GWA1_49_17]
MRKRSSYKKHEHKTDYVYGRVDASRFINYLMTAGKKTAAEKVFYGALDAIKNKEKKDPLLVFEEAMKNASPLVEVRSRRVGGANYQIPQEVEPSRQFFLATHWLINAARKRKGKPMAEKLAEELTSASKNEGEAIKKKQDTHRMAEANRAFASFLRKKR